jgi:hypothetical protein
MTETPSHSASCIISLVERGLQLSASGRDAPNCVTNVVGDKQRALVIAAARTMASVKFSAGTASAAYTGAATTAPTTAATRAV